MRSLLFLLLSSFVFAASEIHPTFQKIRDNSLEVIELLKELIVVSTNPPSDDSTTTFQLLLDDTIVDAIKLLRRTALFAQIEGGEWENIKDLSRRSRAKYFSDKAKELLLAQEREEL
jgi:hypothetical protein